MPQTFTWPLFCTKHFSRCLKPGFWKTRVRKLMTVACNMLHDLAPANPSSFSSAFPLLCQKRFLPAVQQTPGISTLFKVFCCCFPRMLFSDSVPCRPLCLTIQRVLFHSVKISIASPVPDVLYGITSSKAPITVYSDLICFLGIIHSVSCFYLLGCKLHETKILPVFLPLSPAPNTQNVCTF